jgi:glutamate racemase
MASEDRQDSCRSSLNSSASIGVFDSGVGGLSVLCAARAALPQENFIYFADSRYAPYGDKSDAYVIERSERIGAWLVDQGVKAIVVACNTATAIAVQALRAKFALPIVGVEPGLKLAVGVTKSGKVGVLATDGTLASPRYASLLARVSIHAPNIAFFARVGQGWVEAVERGDLGSPQTIDLVASAVAPLIAEGCDALVLGCTHYPFLSAAIQLTAPIAAIIDTAPAIARELVRRANVEAALNATETRGSLRIATTGDAARTATLVVTMLRDQSASQKIETIVT